MAHFTLHSTSGVTVIYSWSSEGGYDAVAFLDDGSRAALIDEVNDARSLWMAGKWIVETANLGSVDDLGDVLGRLYLGATAEHIGCGPLGDIARVIMDLKELRR